MLFGGVYDLGAPRCVDAVRANAAAVIFPIGNPSMPNIRTVNKRHKHAIVEQVARTKAAERAALVDAKPVVIEK